MAETPMPKNNQDANHTPKPNQGASQTYPKTAPQVGTDKTTPEVNKPAKETKSLTDEDEEIEDEEEKE